MATKIIYASQQAPGYAGVYIAKLEVEVWTTLWFVKSGVRAKIESMLFGPGGLKKKKVEQLGLDITLIGQLERGGGGWTNALHSLAVGNHLSKPQVDEFEVKWSVGGRYVRVIDAIDGRDMRVRGIEAHGSIRDGETYFETSPVNLVTM